MNYDPNTGKPINNGYQQINNTNSTNGWAIAGFICSLIMGSILGLIFSIIGLANVKKCNSGKGMALAGIIISILRIVFIVFIIIVFLIPIFSLSTSDKCLQAIECKDSGFGYEICTYKNSSGIKEDVICPINETKTNAKNQKYNKVKMYVFHGQGCSHCKDLFDYLDELKNDKDYKDKFEIVKFETWFNADNSKLMSEFADYFDLDMYSLGVPFYVIGDEYFTGFPSPLSNQYSIDSAHNQIKDAIDSNYGNKNSIDVYEELNKGTNV